MTEPLENWDDKEYVLALVNKNCYLLNYASNRLKDDEDIVMLAVKKYGKSLTFASDRLKDDFDVVLAAVSQDGNSLYHASDRLKDDKKVVLAAVKLNGLALEYAGDRLKDDFDVVLAAVNQLGYALEYASPRLRGDVRFALTCAKNTKNRPDAGIIFQQLIGEAADLFTRFNNNVQAVEDYLEQQVSQQQANEALLVKLTEQSLPVSNSQLFKRKLL